MHDLVLSYPNNFTNMNLIARCKEFRRLLASDCIMIPGCFNGLIARLASEEGRGSTFSIWLPAAPDAPSPASIGSPPVITPG